MKDKIISALAPIDKNIFYGAVTEKNFQMMQSADCIIIAADDIRRKDVSSKDLVITYNIFVVRENYIPEDLIISVINAIEGIPGLRLAGRSNPFEYLPKGKTNIVLETVMLGFTRTIKRC